MLHRRTIALDASGTRITGSDSIGTRSGGLRLAKDAPYAIHFHLHPDVASEIRAGDEASGTGAGVLLTVIGGESWLFDAPHGQLSVEDAIHYSDSVGPRATLQIVLRGASFGESDVDWSLTRV